MQTTEKSNNFYEVLCLCSENNVGINDIKKAYRCMALQYHPDVCNHSNKEESTRRFIELQKAYETLSDPILRENYDYELSLRDYSKGTFGRKASENSRVVLKDVWERQLNGLKRKSFSRMEKKRSN
ncbi:chaperone protein dnaj 20, chloroplastic [Nicotiana attenuata]|uniref:Chaperone protein dnaj 20, chloroplastic n=1 Tax=Nicotiana attenuata TaxID=49451 RepID=A0A1J6K848_NICAT|nr:chaperone protein dnaj 20, chloroplastic [Nicotiana attenuata]